MPASKLWVYQLAFRCGRGGRPLFEPGESARVLAGAARPFTVPAAIGALKRSLPGAGGGLALAAGITGVGPGYFEGAYIGADGSGYNLRLVEEAGTTRASVCSVRNESPAGPIVQASRVPGDLLVFPFSMEGDNFLCVLSPMPAAGESRAEETSAERQSAEFLAQVDSEWRVHRDPGFRLRFVQLGEGSCP